MDEAAGGEVFLPSSRAAMEVDGAPPDPPSSLLPLDSPSVVEDQAEESNHGGTSHSGEEKASSADVDNVLERLGVRHIDEQEARKEVLARAEKRWAAALAARQKAQQQQQSAQSKKPPPKQQGAPSSSVSVSASSAAERPPRPPVSPEQMTQVGETPPEVAEKKRGSVTDGAGNEASAEGNQGKQGGGNGSRIRQALGDEGEAYKVRIGDLTPFEEEQQQRRRRMEAAAAAAEGRGGGGGNVEAYEKLKKKKTKALKLAAGTSKKRPLQQPTSLSSSASTSASAVASESRQRRGAQEQSLQREKRVVSKGTSSSSSATGLQSRERGAPAAAGGGAATSAAVVACPICGRDVAVRDPGKPDKELNEHLDRCMRRKEKRRGARATEDDDEEGEMDLGAVRRSSRRRAAEEVEPERREVVVKEEERNLSFFDDEESEEERPPRRSQEEQKGRSNKNKARRRRDDDDEEDEEGEEEEEEEEERGGAAAKGGKVRGSLVMDDFDDKEYQQRLRDYEESIEDEAGGTRAQGRHGGDNDQEEEKEAKGDEDDDDEVSHARGEGLDPEGEQSLNLPGGFTLSAGINRKLYWYQRTGVRWLWELHQQGAGGILGDEMGLGKTVQLSAFLGGLQESGVFASGLIICPATIISQWVLELFTWAPKLRVIVLHRSGRAFAAQPSHKVNRFVQRCLRMRQVVCITTYESLKTLREVLLPHPWTYTVLDEGQKIRNPDADVTVCAKQLATVHRIILSGTPIQNNLRELWSLFDFVFPGRLGTLPAFEAEMAIPIRVGGYSNASQHQAQLAFRCALVLRELINPYLLRRMKKDIMEILPMPKKTEQVLFCKLTASQRALYRATLSSPEIGLIMEGKASHFRAISVLRKICNHSDLAADPKNEGKDILRKSGERGDHDDDEEGSDDDEVGATLMTMRADYGAVSRSGKLQVLEEVLPRWKGQGHKVLLFSQTRMMLNILEKMVKRHGWRYMRMDGATSVGARPGMIDRFNRDDSIFLFLLTTRTGGLGINLTGADRVVLFDPDWNPQTDVQARERAWRLGQKRPVTIYRLVTTGTIEEKIYQRQIFKTAMSNRVLQDPKQRRLFSSRELAELFTFKEDFDDQDTPNDTADVFAEGVVKQTALRGKKKRRRRAGDDGDGYDDGEEDRAAARARVEEKQEQEDGKILQAVFSGKGLASVLSHDVVEGGSIRERNTGLWLEMQQEARKVAERAARVLRESSAQVEADRGDRFVPTWTGRTGFAGNSQTAAPRFGARSAAFGGGGGSAAMSSSNILSRFREREGGGGAGGGNGPPGLIGGRSSSSDGDGKYVSLLDRIKSFLSSRGPEVPTQAILAHFHDVPQSDAVIFKAMLRQVAVLNDGKWSLKPGQ